MKMYKKMDYYSVVLDGASLGSVLRVFGYDPTVIEGESGLESIFSTVKSVAPAGALKMQFVLPLCRIQLPMNQLFVGGVVVDSVEDVKPSEDFFDRGLAFSITDLKVSGLRVELAGQELDNMRLSGLVPELMFADPLFWLRDEVALDRRVTRVDFAYDFLDYPEDIARQLCIFINEQVASHDKGYRFFLEDKQPSLICRSEFSADETCAYIGRSGSGNVQFLRVYDKIQERLKRLGDQSLWPEYMAEEYRLCDSWFRFELQARGDKAVNLLFRRDAGTGDQLLGEDMMDEVWYQIASHYCLCTEDKKPLPWLRAFYDQVCALVREEAEERKVKIFCNCGKSLGGIECGYTNKREQVGEILRIEKWVVKNISSLTEYIIVNGFDAVESSCNDFLHSLRSSRSLHVARQRRVFDNRLKSMELAIGVNRRMMPGAYINDEGLLRVCKDKIDILGYVPEAEIDPASLYDDIFNDPSFGGPDDEEIKRC